MISGKWGEKETNIGSVRFSSVYKWCMESFLQPSSMFASPSRKCTVKSFTAIVFITKACIRASQNEGNGNTTNDD